MTIIKPTKAANTTVIYKDRTMIHQAFNLGDSRFIAIQSERGLPSSGSDVPNFVTVFPVDDGRDSIETDWLRESIAKFSQDDDVFCTDFLSGVIFTSSTAFSLSTAAGEVLQSEYGTRMIEMIVSPKSSEKPEPGPYYVCQGQLFHIWKLYDDTQGAFLTGLVPAEEDSKLSKLEIAGEGLETTSIAVPSRLKVFRYTPNAGEGKPLAGWRIAVKDIFQVEGIKTSVCNRAYHDLYPPALKTAACIEILRQKGAHILGTTKLAAFAATEEPIECIDYQAPWNPRADGYQSPAGSSSGSGVAVASYDWVDVAIGSDTSGSGRRPGHWNGCFAHRPTHGVIPTNGYIPSFRSFDVPTFFGRSVDTCKEFATHWYSDLLPNATSFLPPQIIYPTNYISLITNEHQKQLIDDFVIDLEKSLGVKHVEMSFDEVWDANPPADAKGASLLEYMKDAGRDSFFYSDYHHFDQFRKDYHDKFGKRPYVSPPVKWQWELSSHITDEAHETALNRLAIYRQWFTEKILCPETQNTIILIPIENLSPRYRDEPLG
ncbi:conserved hypothetical protein [Talaromyces stipitatus ATCC 10500]|nr:uncharacterized protein TSTA_015970 [Talaromyces stipitatus ATCC 10500]XP_002483749.1 uncharacterized protein TSTA_015970 [Talaromyces stipitatus ATCC 10500]EED16514.1 conserved hypothetical protein [Talaromyces stipitatus ATCC 10500]EED16515.1 conserved hypothetical protein [Talaromyces stipitatus ATCC 10500]